MKIQKNFSKILLITFILSFFFIPIEGKIDLKNKTEISIKIEVRKINAQEATWWFSYSTFKDNKNGTGTLTKTVSPLFVKDTSCIKAYEGQGALPNIASSTPCNQGERPSHSTTLIGNLDEFKKNIGIVDYQYGCTAYPSTWANCIVKWIYILIFQPIAFFAVLAARILDFFIYYSISSGSYTGEFIEQGWGVVRDIANIFFIIALLYVAIKTVLGLNSSNNKKMIGTIIIMALLINFSLFITRVVVDSSNILTRVFYSNIESVDSDGKTFTLEEQEEKSITVGLVKQFNPHTIFGSDTSNGIKIEKHLGAFTAILFLSIIMMGYMIFMFLSVALLFVGRVIMLWILMIFAPIAFASVTIPDAKIPGFGWGEWKKQLFNNAFLAPIFVFLLYLIITFGDLSSAVTEGVLTDNTSNFNNLGANSVEGIVTNATFVTYMKVLIPFILIFVLLAKAKSITVKMSGELGEKISKAGKLAGGLAGGVALGGAAFAGTRLIGGGASKIMGSFGERLKSSSYTTDEEGNVIAKKGTGAYLGRLGLKTLDKTTSATFDARKTKVGGQISKISGMDFQSSDMLGLGSKKGGFRGVEEEQRIKEEKEKELFKSKMTDSETRDFSLKRRGSYLRKQNEFAERAVMRKRSQGATEAEIKKEEVKARADYVLLAGAIPKMHTKTQDLNKERMDAYKDNIGQTGLLSSISHDLVGIGVGGGEMTQSNYFKGDNRRNYLEALKRRAKKKAKEEAEKAGEFFDANAWEDKYGDSFNKDTYDFKSNKYDKSIGREITNKRANKVKLTLGAGAVLATGGGAGLAVGGGVVGAGIGAAAGAGLAASQTHLDSSVDTKVRNTIEKEMKATEKLSDRIKDLDNIFEEGKKMTTTIPPIIIGGSSTTIPLVSEDGRVNKEALSNAITNNAVKQKTENIKLEKAPGDPRIEAALRNLIKEKQVLDQLKTVEEKKYNLTGKKSGVTGAGSGGSSSGGTSGGGSSSGGTSGGGSSSGGTSGGGGTP